MGTPAMTTRGFQPADFARVAEIVDRAVVITQKIDRKAKADAEAKGKKNPGSLKTFLEFVGPGAGEGQGEGLAAAEGTGAVEMGEVWGLRREVEEWVGTFGEPWLKREKEGSS